MWSERELFKLGQYKRQCVLALDIHYFPFGYFFMHRVLQISLSSAQSSSLPCTAVCGNSNRGHVPREAYRLHRGSKQTKHQGKELTEGSSSHIFSPSVMVPHGLVLLYSDPVITLSKCLTDFAGTRWKHSNGHWADMF